jgi:hypothetical protein
MQNLKNKKEEEPEVLDTQTKSVENLENKQYEERELDNQWSPFEHLPNELIAHILSFTRGWEGIIISENWSVGKKRAKLAREKTRFKSERKHASKARDHTLQ